MQAKRLPILKILVASLCTILLASCERPKSNTTPDTIRIGVLACLTGPAAEYGKQVLDGAKMGAADFEKENHRHVELVVQDTKSTPKDAVAAFQQLTDINGIKFVIGDVLSGSVMAIAPLANQKGVLVFAPGASTPALDDIDDMIVRNWVSDSYDAKIMADYCNRQNFGKIAVLYVNNEYGNSLAKRFRQFLNDADKRIVLASPFAEDATNFLDVVDKLLAAKADAVYLIGYSKSIGMIARQLHERVADHSIQLLSNLAASEPQTIEIGGDALNGLVFTDPNQTPALEWSERYTKTTGSKPGVVSAHSYDATRILLASISTTKGDISSVKESLYRVKNYPGVSGTTTINQFGDAQKPVFLRTIRTSAAGSTTKTLQTVSP